MIHYTYHVGKLVFKFNTGGQVLNGTVEEINIVGNTKVSKIARFSTFNNSVVISSNVDKNILKILDDIVNNNTFVQTMIETCGGTYGTKLSCQ